MIFIVWKSFSLYEACQCTGECSLSQNCRPAQSNFYQDKGRTHNYNITISNEAWKKNTCQLFLNKTEIKKKNTWNLFKINFCLINTHSHTSQISLSRRILKSSCSLSQLSVHHQNSSIFLSLEILLNLQHIYIFL